jgi:hypothetical protein
LKIIIGIQKRAGKDRKKNIYALFSISPKTKLVLGSEADLSDLYEEMKLAGFPCLVADCRLP